LKGPGGREGWGREKTKFQEENFLTRGCYRFNTRRGKKRGGKRKGKAGTSGGRKREDRDLEVSVSNGDASETVRILSYKRDRTLANEQLVKKRTGLGTRKR